MTQTVVLECPKGKKLKKSSGDCSSAMMGKVHQFSKGHSSGLVPDYMHAAETVGESEGFSRSGRADSEDSCTRKRKCISLNADPCNGLNVPLQVISVSKMSRSERQELKTRLRRELEQVQMFQKKSLSRIPTAVNGIALSSTRHTKNSSQLMRGITSRFESAKRAPPPPVTNSDAMLMKQCKTLLKNLMTHRFSWVFINPVDVVKLNLPDYFTVIKHPMDLGRIMEKLETRAYSSPWGFVSDVRLTFTNAMTYNPPGSDVHIMANTMNKLFDKRWKSIEKKLAAPDVDAKRETEAAKPVSQPKKRKTPPINDSVIVSDSVMPKMTNDQKQKLSRQLCSLSEDLPGHILDFLKVRSKNAKQTSEDEIEVDLDFLSDDALVELQKLLDDYLQVKQSAPQAKDEPCEMEIFNEPGLSNSSMHPCNGNDPADEDVDIGGNDPPVSSYPPVEIEKDAPPKSSKCSSSSSSSSGSDSSSSDSDSGSSSGSESDVKVDSPAKLVKENRQSGAAMDQEINDAMNPLDLNRTGSRLDQPEQGARLNPASIEAYGLEGESAPSERQVSPDKLYRAALLRSRFADTILKAREKTLDQGEKRDPEKLRREREELKRQQRKEKARLQAEAKAAEDARRQAEAESAAEAKRKLELEREAARQALLQMEKSVEINESSFFLKDLEMLRTAPSEHIASSADEMSPDHLQEGIEGFKLGGSNFLEQLGLYMKADDEEEGGPSSTVPVNDFEEGEID